MKKIFHDELTATRIFPTAAQAKTVNVIPAGRDESVATDQELCRAFLAGDDRAYLELYTRFSGRVISYIRKILGMYGDGRDVKDVFQTVWMKAFRMREWDRPVEKFEIVLFRIARNESISMLRKHKVEFLEEHGDVESPRRASETLEHNELRALLTEALGSLPVALREVFILREEQGVEIVEVAEIIGISENLVRVRYHRAKHELRKFITNKLRLTEGDDPTEFI